MTTPVTTCKRPESVLVVVSHQQREILLLERCHPEGFWQSITGSLEWDEQPIEAAKRELYEETGIHTESLTDCHKTFQFPIHPEWKKFYADDVSSNTEHVFMLDMSTRPEVTLNQKEHVRYKWLDREMAAAKVFSWTNREVIENLTEYLKLVETTI